MKILTVAIKRTGSKLQKNILETSFVLGTKEMTECQKETPKTSTDLFTTRVLFNMNCQQVIFFLNY